MSQLRHISRPAFRALSHVSSHNPTCVSCHISRRVFRHDFAISKCAPGHGESDSLCDLKMRTAPQRDRFDPPKFALRSQTAHRATARATRLAQSAQRVHFAISKCPKSARGFTLRSPNAHCHSESDSTHQSAAPATKSTRKLESTAPATKSAQKDLKCGARPRNLHEQLESAAPVKKKYVTATCKTLKMLCLPRNQNLTLLHRTRKTSAGL